MERGPESLRSPLLEANRLRAIANLAAFNQQTRIASGENPVPHNPSLLEDIEAFLARSETAGVIVLPDTQEKKGIFIQGADAMKLQVLIVVQSPRHSYEDIDENLWAKNAWALDRSTGATTIATYDTLMHQASLHEKNKRRQPAYDSDFDHNAIQLLLLHDVHLRNQAQVSRILRMFPHAIQIGIAAVKDTSEEQRVTAVLPTIISRITKEEAITERLLSPTSSNSDPATADLETIEVFDGTSNNPKQDKVMNEIVNENFESTVERIFRQRVDPEKLYNFLLQTGKDALIQEIATGSKKGANAAYNAYISHLKQKLE